MASTMFVEREPSTPQCCAKPSTALWKQTERSDGGRTTKPPCAGTSTTSGTRVLPDIRISGLDDASTIIRARYILSAGATLQEQLETLYTLNWRQFEFLTARLWEAMGYTTEVTPGSKDRGKDVVAVKSEPERETVYISCKHWHGKVDVESVSSLLGRVDQDRATRGVVIGTGGFTTGETGAIGQFGEVPRVSLVPGVRMVSLLNEHLGRDWVRNVDRLATPMVASHGGFMRT